MITLPTKQFQEFFRLYHHLLLYTNNKHKKFGIFKSREQMLNQLSLEDIVELREKMYEDLEIFDQFIIDNPYNFNSKEIKTIQEWKQFNIKDDFFVLNHLKQHSIFMQKSGDKAYGIKSLSDPLNEIMESTLPMLIHTVILPFNEGIVHDGLCQHYSISFGPGIRSHLKEDYIRAKAKYGIITQLPYKSPENEQEHLHAEKEQLSRYMKTEKRSNEFQAEIFELKRKDPELEALYFKELARLGSNYQKRALKMANMKSVYFAQYGYSTVAIGASKKEVEQSVKTNVPRNLQAHIYYFQMK